MISAKEAQNYTKKFEPSAKMVKEILEPLEAKIKAGERHPRVYTTNFHREASEELAKYLREELGYRTARIQDIYNQRTGQRGGNYLIIDLV